MTITPVILSGGSGTRLWPLSTADRPKQFLPLVSDRTMIQETLLRLEGLETAAPVVSCGGAHAGLVARQIGEVSEKRPTIIVEPVAKNTAPAIAAACLAAVRADRDAVVVVLPSDHVIRDAEAFRKAVAVAARQAEKGFLVTFGIVPAFPATGYGYVKASGPEEGGARVLEKFVEKPDAARAREYVASGEYCWNSGMFVFRAGTFLDELARLDGDMCGLVRESFRNAVADGDFLKLDPESFSRIKGNSIDYAVMEKTRLGKIVSLDAGWDDIGSWDALYGISRKDADGNAFRTPAVAHEAKNCYVNARKPVALVGVENLVVVESDGYILVADRDHAQDVKVVAEKYRNIKK